MLSKTSRFIVGFALLSLFGLSAACSETPTAPSAVSASDISVAGNGRATPAGHLDGVGVSSRPLLLPPGYYDCPDTITIPVDFVQGNKAEVTADAIDAALAKLNEIFRGCCIVFTRNSFSPINDPNAPATPTEEGQDKWTKDMTTVANAGEKAAKTVATPSKLVVVIVQNFNNASRPGHSNINGITGGSTVLIADPFHVGANTMGGEEFWHTLAHELAHALGLGHKVLKSDAKYPSQQNGEYTAPNLMAREGVPANTELTSDQCDELKKGARKFAPKGK